jgi:DNA processing protein
LYVKGNPEFDRPHIISIVGTRSATEYGRKFCEDLIADLAPLQPVIVSGLAYGIDICAHRAALQSGLGTIACLAHGLDRIYPPLHTETAKQMLETGGWVTENISGADPERESFPMRNRIIAGLADCTVVVESDKKGGSMLTAYIAESYGRSVFALPGSIHDRFSQGPHQLIRKQVATLITCAEDLKDAMSWSDRKPAKRKQVSLFPDLSADETAVLNAMETHGKVHLDDLAQHTSLSHSRLSGTLLELEFKGLVKSLPGKTYATM